MIELDLDNEYRIYAFLSQEILEQKYPGDKEMQDRVKGSSGCIAVNKLTCEISINYYQLSLSSEKMGFLITALNKARNIADKLAEEPKAASYRKNGY
jgi:hypothetical protein